MSQTVEAVFDGEILRPVEPINLEPNTKVRLTLEVKETTAHAPQSFLRTARNFNLEGPADWSANLDNDLYGKKRHSDG